MTRLISNFADSVAAHPPTIQKRRGTSACTPSAVRYHPSLRERQYGRPPTWLGVLKIDRCLRDVGRTRQPPFAGMVPGGRKTVGRGKEWVRWLTAAHTTLSSRPDPMSPRRTATTPVNALAADISCGDVHVNLRLHPGYKLGLDSVVELRSPRYSGFWRLWIPLVVVA